MESGITNTNFWEEEIIKALQSGRLSGEVMMS